MPDRDDDYNALLGLAFHLESAAKLCRDLDAAIASEIDASKRRSERRRQMDQERAPSQSADS
jgi:hypothetical protein